MFHYFKRTIFCFIIIFSLNGCFLGSSKVIKEDIALPSWYIKTPLNNEIFIYGEGESSSLSDAKNNALNSMASKLIVNVKSTTSSKTTTSQDESTSTYSKDVQKNVKIDVEKIKFTNAIVEKSTQVSGTFYILMKVNRQTLFKNKKNEFEINDKRIRTQIKSLSRYDKLEQIKILQQIYPHILKAKKEAIVLNAINNDFNQTSYIEKYDSYLDMIADLKNSVSIRVKTNNSKSYFSDILIDMLNQQQYKVSYTENSDVVVSLKNRAKFSIARGWNIVKVTTTISVISSNKIISNSIISTIGRSSTSRESALQNASENFLMQLEKKTLDNVIFGQ